MPNLDGLQKSNRKLIYSESERHEMNLCTQITFLPRVEKNSIHYKIPVVIGQLLY